MADKLYNNITNDKAFEKLKSLFMRVKDLRALFSMSYRAYGIIKKAKKNERPILLRYFCENVKYSNQEASQETADTLMLNESQYNLLKNHYGTYVFARIDMIVKCNFTEDVFYDRLWSLIENDDFISLKRFANEGIDDISLKAYILTSIAADANIPYFHIENSGLVLNDSDFQKLIEKNNSDIKRMRFILTTTGIETVTERASHVLDIIKDKQAEDKAILMYSVMAYFIDNIIAIKEANKGDA